MSFKNALSEKLQNNSVYQQNLEAIEHEAKIFLKLPRDLLKVFQTPLKERFQKLQLSPKIELQTSEPETVSSSTLEYHVQFDLAHSDKNPKQTDLNIKGLPEPAKRNPFKRDQNLLTDLEKRVIELSGILTASYKNPRMKTLIHQFQNLRELHWKIDHLNDQILSLDKKIHAIDRPYHHALSYILIESIERLTGVLSLEDIMKRLMKILIIDDQGNRTLEGLDTLGFNKKYLTAIRINDLNTHYQEYFRENLAKGISYEKLNMNRFLMEGEFFNQFDIVLINLWHPKKDMLPIHVRLRKKTTLSKKEETVLGKNPEKQAKEMYLKEQKCLQLKKQLADVLQQLKQFENGKVTANENEYQSLENKRKRLHIALQNEKNKLKQIHPQTKTRDKVILYVRGLFKTFQNRQTWKDNLEDQIYKLSGFNVLKRFFVSDNHLSFYDLQEMAKLAVHRHPLENNKAHLEETRKQL
ncbi:MAG: hypothetical protein HQM12_20885, partial [SAR324 cluster bacterium]|nr:hypothetical protein [SAR324 cluster bacterium]